MNATALRLYHHLPGPARSAAASLRGLQLRHWRYGRETESLISQAVERESWSDSQWQAWRSAALPALLSRAASRVPYYREQWARRRREGDRSPVDRLESWPVLSKETLRQQARAFVADDCDPRRMFHEHTSGTTGKPLDLWWSRATVRAWYALFESRVRRWNGVSRRDRWGMLGGQLVIPVGQSKPPFWVWNRGLNQLYMSSYHLAPRTVAAYLNAMRRYRVAYLFGYASSLDSLARLAEEEGLAAPRAAVAISNAEALLDHQRERIARVFGCPVRNTYGMAEIVGAGSECASGQMHAWPEVGAIELLQDDHDGPVDPGRGGRLVSTGLLNTDMPLIRYDTGDRGVSNGNASACPCGRRLPLLESLEGRSDDVIVTPDGRRVGRLDPVFKMSLAIREAQIVQESASRIRVRVVAADGFGESDVRAISDGLHERLGAGVEVCFERVDSIARTRNGKFRAVVSEIGRSTGSAERP